MVLHIGGDTIVATENVVAIIDVETANSSKEMRQYFDKIKKEFERKNNESCKTYIITCSFDKRKCNLKSGMPDKDCTIYCSTISSSTLFKRCGFVDKING